MAHECTECTCSAADKWLKLSQKQPSFPYCNDPKYLHLMEVFVAGDAAVKELTGGLEKALTLLGDAVCENCGGSLAEKPAMGQCGDFSHTYNAGEIARLRKLLPKR